MWIACKMQMIFFSDSMFKIFNSLLFHILKIWIQKFENTEVWKKRDVLLPCLLSLVLTERSKNIKWGTDKKCFVSLTRRRIAYFENQRLTFLVFISSHIGDEVTKHTTTFNFYSHQTTGYCTQFCLFLFIPSAYVIFH